MKKTKFLRHLTSFVVTLSIVLPLGIGNLQPVSAAENSKTPSQAYVEAMGKGWNLGNTFEAFDPGNPQFYETAWGNPVVTKDLIKSIKDKGFKSIRMPFAVTTRYTLVDGHYVINADFLKRYKEVVDWAVADGLYVQIDLHDVWNWLSNKWDGNKTSVPYLMLVDFWTQTADYFKDEPNQVFFETANELGFDNDTTVSDTETITKQAKMDMLNQAAYDIIRKSGGSNATRMILIPTNFTSSDAEKVSATSTFITGLNDPNIIATVHFYSDWVYSANNGRTGFDESLWGDDYTPRKGVDQLFNTINDGFISKGIGVIIGEYGLLNDEVAQYGEKIKYFEDMNYMATKYKVALMLWDPYCFIDRNDTENYSWKQPEIGTVMETAIKGERSSYATGLNEIYLSQPVDKTIQIPLTINGNLFIGIDGLTYGKDYAYDSATATVTLSKDFVNSKFNAIAANKYGNIVDLVMQFSAGADWHQYLIKNAAPVLKPATGTTTLSIPVDFNGSKLRRAWAYDASGNKVGPLSEWWPFLPFGGSFNVDHDNSTINILSDFLNYSNVKDGTIKFTFEFYDGQKLNYILEKSGTSVTGKSDVDVFNVTFDSKEGTAVDSTSLYKDSLIAKPADPTKEGFTFNGWYSDSDGTILSLTLKQLQLQLLPHYMLDGLQFLYILLLLTPTVDQLL